MFNRPSRKGLLPIRHKPDEELALERFQIRQGHLESSNFSPAEASVKLIGVLRQFETLQRAMQLGGEMGRKAVEDVAG